MNLAQLLKRLPSSYFSPAVGPAEIGDALGMMYSHEGTHGLEPATSKLGPSVTANGAGDVKDGQPMTNHHDCHFLGKQPLFACRNGYYVAAVAIHTKDHTKKGRKKKETPDPGLTLGTDIEDHLKQDGRQVEVELDNVRINQEKTKGQIRQRDAKLLQKRIESLEAAPPTGPLHVVLWEDNSMLQTDFSLFSLREPSRKDVSHICGWRLLVCIWTAQRGSCCEDSGEATHRVSGSAAVAYYMHRRYSKAYDTVGLPCKAGGTSTRKRTRR